MAGITLIEIVVIVTAIVIVALMVNSCSKFNPTMEGKIYVVTQDASTIKMPGVTVWALNSEALTELMKYCNIKLGAEYPEYQKKYAEAAGDVHNQNEIETEWSQHRNSTVFTAHYEHEKYIIERFLERFRWLRGRERVIKHREGWGPCECLVSDDSLVQPFWGNSPPPRWEDKDYGPDADGMLRGCPEVQLREKSVPVMITTQPNHNKTKS